MVRGGISNSSSSSSKILCSVRRKIVRLEMLEEVLGMLNRVKRLQESLGSEKVVTQHEEATLNDDFNAIQRDLRHIRRILKNIFFGPVLVLL